MLYIYDKRRSKGLNYDTEFKIYEQTQQEL
jgi:hypothetical protein